MERLEGSLDSIGVRDLVRISALFTIIEFVRMDIIMPSYLARLGADPAALGLIYSTGAGARSIARVLGGIVMSLVGWKRLVATSFLIRILSYLLLSYSNRLECATIAIISISASRGLETPAYLSAIALASGSAVARGFGLALSLRMAPGIIAPLLTGLIAEHASPIAVFMISGTLCLASLVMVVMSRNWEGTSNFSFKRCKHFLSQQFALLLISTFTLFTAVGSFRPFFYYWITDELRQGYATLGVIVTVSEILALFSRVYSGVLAERIGYSTAFALVGVVRSLSLLAMSLSSSLIVVVASFLTLRSIMAAPSRNALISRMVPKELYGVAYALVGLAADMGGALGPALIGYIIGKYGFQIGFTTLAAIYLVFTAVALQLKKLRSIDVESC